MAPFAAILVFAVSTVPWAMTLVVAMLVAIDAFEHDFDLVVFGHSLILNSALRVGHLEFPWRLQFAAKHCFDQGIRSIASTS
jgi:hypothetical protein